MKIGKKQKWGLTFLLLVALVYVFIYVLDTGKNDDSVTEIYFADRVTAAHEILIDKYNELNKGKVKVIPIDFPNYEFSTNERKELLARSLRGRGDGIDLFAVDIIWVQRFAKWCEPLDEYVTKEEKAGLLGHALESCYFDGKLVALPLDRVQGVMYYRDDILSGVNGSEVFLKKFDDYITWEEFIEFGKRFGDEKPFYVFPADDYEGLICSFMELVMGLKPDYYTEYGFNFITPEAERALQLLVDLVNTHNVSPPVVTEFSEIPSYEYFIKNDGVFIRGWPSYDKDFQHAPFDEEKEKHLKKVPIPYFKEGNPASVFGGWSLMVSKFSDKKEEAVDFIKFLISDESQEFFYKVAGYYPVTKSFYTEDEYLEKYPESKKMRELLRTVVHRPSHPEYTRYSKLMSHYFEMAINKKIGVKEALEKATAAIKTDQIIAKQF